MAKVEPRPPTPYEKFVEATKTILSVSKKEVDKAAQRWKRSRKKHRK